ncbi:arylalcohol dehydrogenase [Fomitiporia mediterranea MF3/22]|uniref:arylalcohol dehydrogenase n=1 Tax=Fomitiporia mediterranea (strain MF3/22) TaxID=694068 RepID=UPI000440948F|nr:arylalcohol dehydrogenase [Fomitiporia mediterranea MF3/22]EJD05123.1 arylalcohol dehydrogenase [Fomitiporia mediterranea MF3/22]
MSFAPAPPPSTPLGRYRVLSPLAGVRVSPLQLGGGNIGDQHHKIGMGAMDKESSFKLLDAYFEAGGNFIDTANVYQSGTSESFIGEWAEKRGIRDQLVIATKYTMMDTAFTENNLGIKVNFYGNNTKSMRINVDQSLKRLCTHYIDIFYIHFWDFTTSVEEVMDALHNLVSSGKVLYLGISDAPAWVVVHANMYAKQHGKTPFVIYQGAWNVMDRSFEREIIPMARAHGLALAPWNVLASGRFRTDAEEERRAATGEKGRTILRAEWKRDENEKKMSVALEKVAKEVGTEHITAVAIAYVMQKTPYVFPIIGGRKVEHLMANIEALKILISEEQMKYLESIIPFEPGFPHDIIVSNFYQILALFLTVVIETGRWYRSTSSYSKFGTRRYLARQAGYKAGQSLIASG